MEMLQTIAAGVSIFHDAIETGMWGMDVVSSLCKPISKSADKKELIINTSTSSRPKATQTNCPSRKVETENRRASLQERLNFKDKTRYREFQVSTALLKYSS